MEKRKLTPASYSQEPVIPVVLGPQAYMFPETVKKTFFNSTYTVSPASDRMGVRLAGPELRLPQGTDIISDGVVTGSIQVPNDGQPIILLSDRQTTGGYAKIATVLSTAISLAAQVMPGGKLSFSEISVADAQKRYIQKQKY